MHTISSMHTICADNVNDAWHQAKVLLNNWHVVRPSRVGDVWEAPGPVVTEYRYPKERVLFDPLRNCNPYFHLFESLWMLAGRNDIEFLAQFNGRMILFSDDGKTQRGAYGYRWRQWFTMERNEPPDVDTSNDGSDQLNRIVRMLRKSHDERRAVLAMWDANEDLERPDSKDVPCNTQVYFKIRNSALDATVTCRSNDIVWGAYGANAVHFSYLLEYMAARIGVPVGTMYVLSDSWHAYTEFWDKYGGNQDSELRNPYTSLVYSSSEVCSVTPYPLVKNVETFDGELESWLRASPTLAAGHGSVAAYRNPFFLHVATPMLRSWSCYKAGHLHAAKTALECCHATDWRLAAEQWLDRVEKKRHAKETLRQLQSIEDPK